MTSWTAYPIFVATLISTVGLTHLAIRTRTIGFSGLSLSELAVTEERALARFRSILILCGCLFAITVFGFLAPRARDKSLIVLFGFLMITGELIAAAIPAKGKYFKVHLSLAVTMAVGMFGLAATFWLTQAGTLSDIEFVSTVILCIFAVLMTTDKRRYIFHELGFIFTSHLSLIVAAVLLK